MWMKVDMAKTMKAKCIRLLVRRLRRLVRMKRGAAKNHKLQSNAAKARPLL